MEQENNKMTQLLIISTYQVTTQRANCVGIAKTIMQAKTPIPFRVRIAAMLFKKLETMIFDFHNASKPRS